MLQNNCRGFCDVCITCCCCDLQFCCMCALHLHLIKEKNVLKYSIDVDLCRADDLVMKNSIANGEIPKVNDTCSSENKDNSQRRACDNDFLSSANDSKENKTVINIKRFQNACERFSIPSGDQKSISIERFTTTSSSLASFNEEKKNFVTHSDTPMSCEVTDQYASCLADSSRHAIEKDEVHITELMSQKGCSSSRGKSRNFKVPCDICGYLFKRCNLKRHMQSHAATKEFTCEICHKVFRTESSLHCHKLHHSIEKVHLCHFCGKLFNNGPNLRQHLKSHTRERILKCPLCQKMFRSNYVLKDHLSRHSDEKPYACKLCNHSFRKSPELKRHMTAHSEAREHSCTICSKAFKSKSNRIKHENIHYKMGKGPTDLSGNRDIKQ